MELKFKDMDGYDEVTVTKVNVEKGQNVKKGDNIIDAEADKASGNIIAEADGIVSNVLVKIGDTIKSGAVIIELGGEISDTKSSSSSSNSIIKPEPPVASSKKIEQPAQQTGKVLSTPVARAMARSLGIDIKQIKGSGREGKILKSDLLAYNQPVTSSDTATTPINSTTTVAAATISSPGINVTKIESFGKVEHLPLSGIRKAVANQMSLSVYTAPHVSLMINVDAESLVQLRTILKEPAAQDPDGSAKLTFMPFFVKAVAKALKEERFKLLNSTLNIANNEILIKKYYNIGMAADTEKGLVVPVIKNADQLSLFEIARQVNSLGDKARKGLLKGEEMQGGSFTITNFGSAGIEMGTPVINYPEVAILGLGMMQKKLVIVDGKIVEHKFFPLSLSIDHRVIDGAPAGYFLSRLKELLENPTLILA